MVAAKPRTLSRLIAYVTNIMAFCVLHSPVLCCEDDHPPIIKTPTKEFRARDRAGKILLTVSFDPRGIGGMVPVGDASDAWIAADDPTGVWHYREWQWWNGHSWGESCRPRFYADVEFRAWDHSPRGAQVRYQIDGFDCRQLYLLPEKLDRDAPYWDLVTTIRNTSGHDVKEYGQFFACYTPLNRGRSFWYWDESQRLVLFADRKVKHLDGYVANPDAYFLEGGAIPHCPRGGGKIVGRWRHPVVVSQASPAGWRSVIFLEAAHTAALTQGIEGGAMDYILLPSTKNSTFGDGEEFSVHIRHVMLKSAELPTIRRIERIWTDFEKSHASAKERSAKL
jgi:hypothetical protein